MNRIDRVSAILIQLQSRSVVKAQQIAERFDISLRTVYRDIRALEEAGIPIIGNPGIGYSLVEGFKLPPLMFTKEEAIAFLTAEKLINELSDSGSSKQYQSGMEKIRAVLRFVEKELLEDIDERIGILKVHHPIALQSGDLLQVIIKSIANKRIMSMSYVSGYKQENSERKVEPVGVFFSRAHWYLIAFCLKRMEYRTFRIERIQHILPLDEPVAQQHPPLNTFLENLSNSKELEEVTVRLKKENAFLIAEEKYLNGLFAENETGNYIEYSFLTFSLDKFSRWYMTFADVAEIVKPQALKNKVQQLLNSSISKLK